MADSRCLVLRCSPSLARCRSQSHGLPPQYQILVHFFLSLKEHSKKKMSNWVKHINLKIHSKAFLLFIVIGPLLHPHFTRWHLALLTGFCQLLVIL